MSIFGKIMQDKSPLKPHLLDDHSHLDKVPEGLDYRLRDIVERVQYEDNKREHNFDTLTPDEKLEIQLFHSYKQDPYFKHYLTHGQREQVDDLND